MLPDSSKRTSLEWTDSQVNVYRSSKRYAAGDKRGRVDPKALMDEASKPGCMGPISYATPGCSLWQSDCTHRLLTLPFAPAFSRQDYCQPLGLPSHI